LAFGLVLNKFHKYTLARVYAAVLAHALPTLIIVLVLGQSYFAQFYILLSVMLMFIAFPPEESKFVHLTVLIGFLCFTITMTLSNPVIKADIQALAMSGKPSVPEEFLTGEVFILVCAFIALGYVFRHIWLSTEEALRIEREKSERLLRNILPAPIAERLKSGQQTIADAFEETTILFADIVGFTTLSERTSPDQLVAMLNTLFSRFDDLTEKHGLEKIKTIGDAYMVVAGLPEHRHDHAQAIAAMALDMHRTMTHFNASTGHALELRIGINSGAVTAGVIGKKKFSYDLWGDAVNTAARMESHGIPGEIQVSQTTYDLLKDTFAFEERGLIELKGKGLMSRYLLRGKLHSFS
jgi:class 3 adenylate cyclase